MVLCTDRLVSTVALCSALSVVVPLPLLGQGMTPKAPEYEEFLDEVNVSGQTWRGVMFGELERNIRPGWFTFWLPSESEVSSAPTLCVDILSLDGLYRARYKWEYAELKRLGFGKIHTRPIETGHEAKLDGMTAEQLALRAVLGGDCDREDSVVLLASWQDKADVSIADGIQVAVLVNNPEGRAFVTRSGHDPSGCVNMDGASRSLVAYDKICRIEVDRSMTGQLLTIQRWDGLDRQEPVTISLRWGAPTN